MNIRTKLLVILLALSLLGSVVTSLIGYYNAKDRLLSATYQQMAQQVAAYGQGMNTWLDAKAKLALYAAETLTIIPDITTQHVQGFKIDKDVSDLYVGLEASGKLIDGTGFIPPADFDARKRPWYKAAVAKNGLVFSEPYEDVVTKKLVVPAAVPLKAADG